MVQQASAHLSRDREQQRRHPQDTNASEFFFWCCMQAHTGRFGTSNIKCQKTRGALPGKAQVYWGLETEGKDKVVCFRPTEVLGLGTGVTTAEGWPKLRTDCLVGLAWAACSFRLVPKGIFTLCTTTLGLAASKVWRFTPCACLAIVPALERPSHGFLKASEPLARCGLCNLPHLRHDHCTPMLIMLWEWWMSRQAGTVPRPTHGCCISRLKTGQVCSLLDIQGTSGTLHGKVCAATGSLTATCDPMCPQCRQCKPQYAAFC